MPAAILDTSRATVLHRSRLSITHGPAISVRGPPATPTLSFPTSIIRSLSIYRRGAVAGTTTASHGRRRAVPPGGPVGGLRRVASGSARVARRPVALDRACENSLDSRRLALNRKLVAHQIVRPVRKRARKFAVHEQPLDRGGEG